MEGKSGYRLLRDNRRYSLRLGIRQVDMNDRKSSHIHHKARQNPHDFDLLALMRPYNLLQTQLASLVPHFIFLWRQQARLLLKKGAAGIPPAFSPLFTETKETRNHVDQTGCMTCCA